MVFGFQEKDDSKLSISNRGFGDIFHYAMEKIYSNHEGSNIDKEYIENAIPKIKKELQTLGMWDDSTIFLNTDFVWSKTNVVKYPEDFIAIHGVNQFFEKEHKKRT